ncbi:MAG: rod shape-determining protein MreC [Phycisphaerae bacterium]
MSFDLRRPSKKSVFVVLMLLSAVSVFLPPQVTDAAKHTPQLLVPFQDLVYYATHWASRSVSRIGEGDTFARQDHDALMRQIVSQAGLIEQLRDENRRLGALRHRAIPLALQAQVVARDIAEWRRSLLIERGSELGVRRKDWLASHLFLDQGRFSHVRQGQAVIAREVLLGRVEQVSPYMSRVQLFTDVNCPPIEVRVGAPRDGGFEFVDYPCSLRGRGRGEMAILDVDYHHVRAEPDENAGSGPRRIRIGDYVCSAPGQLGLPEPMVIGRVVAFEQDPTKRLVFDVIVKPDVPLDQIRYVHVIPLLPADGGME